MPAPATALSALADPTRQLIIERLRRGPQAVGEIARDLPVSRPAVSQHLAVLKQSGLVSEERVGRRHVYRLDAHGLEPLRAFVDALWADVLAAYRRAAEAEAQETRSGGPMMAEKMAPDAGVRAAQPVVKEVTVPLPPARAFALFTDDVGSWWPLASHSVGGRDAVECHFEPRAGGRLVETTSDGTHHEWGTILAWEPPTRIAMTWHPGRGPETAQRLEVTFTPAPGGTRLRLVHSGWERLSDVGGGERRSYDTGWNTVLDRYTTAAAGQQTA